jgi:hypothetical protein
MKAFLYIDLTSSATYHKELLGKVKQAFPELALLDMDGRSEELLQHYALKLLREGEQVIVCIKAEEQLSDISILMPFMEELFQNYDNKLILLLGSHNRLNRILSARPNLTFKNIDEREVVLETQKFICKAKQD